MMLHLNWNTRTRINHLESQAAARTSAPPSYAQRVADRTCPKERQNGRPAGVAAAASEVFAVSTALAACFRRMPD